MSGLEADWARVAVGSSHGTSLGRRWHAVRTVHAAGRSEKIEARVLGGVDHGGGSGDGGSEDGGSGGAGSGDGGSGGGGYVSANLYRLAAGPLLLPCEMPAGRVLAFLADWRPDTPAPCPRHGSDRESPARDASVPIGTSLRSRG